jgi:hypothetical protein
MDKPQRMLEIRLGELRPVVDATELTRGLRGKIVGGRKRSARLVPAEGGMSVELLGSSTFVPIAVGTLEKELTVDAHLLAGFLRNSIRAFHPAEIVGLQIGPEHLIGTCGTLKVTLMLGDGPAPSRHGREESLVQTSPELRPMEAESKATPVEDNRRIPEPPAGQASGDEKKPKRLLIVGPPLMLTCADGKPRAGLYRIEEIERALISAKRQRPDYKALSFVAAGWFLLLALSELVFGGVGLAWWVAAASISVFVEAWSDRTTQFEWEKKRWKKEVEIAEIRKRIEMLGYSARKEPANWVLKPVSKSRHRSPD